MFSLDLEAVTTTATGMRGLADVPFDMQTFHAACERLGERLPPLGDWRWPEYELPDGSLLQLCQYEPAGPVVLAEVGLYGWDDDLDSAESFLRRRRESDDAYAIALAAARAAAGPPLLSGIYEAEHLQWAF